MSDTIYKCEWFEGEYSEYDIDYNDISWFCDDRGYDEDDIELIENLEIGDSVRLGMGGHKVTLIEKTA